jgi:hypothetical protein
MRKWLRHGVTPDPIALGAITGLINDPVKRTGNCCGKSDVMVMS